MLTTLVLSAVALGLYAWWRQRQIKKMGDEMFMRDLMIRAGEWPTDNQAREAQRILREVHGVEMTLEQAAHVWIATKKELDQQKT